MFESFVSVGILGLLLVGLGLNTSLQRLRAGAGQAAAEADPASALRKAIRAHANCAEYAPMIAVLCLIHGQRDPSFGLEMTMYAAVASRVVHAIGALSVSNVYGVDPFRALGAAGTYGAIGILAAALLLEAPTVW